MTNKERLQANNEKIQAIQEILNSKMLKASGQGKYFVKVVDYDGTILKEARLDTGDTFTLPDAPSHDGLVFQEWSCSQEIVDGVITIADNNVMVGATYTTESGLSEFDIELTKVTGLNVTLNMDGTKDWGDGTSDDLTTHTYTDYGKYTIKCNGTTMTISSSSGLFNQSSGARNYYCVSVRLSGINEIGSYAFAYCLSLRNVVISNDVSMSQMQVFQDCYSLINVIIPSGVSSVPYGTFRNNYALQSVTIPNGATKVGDYAFEFCCSLNDIVIPNSVTSISGQAFQYCRSLRNIILPDGITNLGSSAFADCFSLMSLKVPDGVPLINMSTFRSCSSLASLTLPQGATRMNGSACFGCYSLTSIIIPKGVTLVGGDAFRQCYALTIYDFSKLTAIPTLSTTGTLDGINNRAKIIVPDNLYDEWIIATNWATYANYIYKASEVQ